MPRIYVEFSGLDQIGSCCKTVASRVDTIQSNFQRTVRQLDWDIRFESNINSTATQLSRKLEQYSRALETYQRFIEDTKSEYFKLDEYKQLTLTASPVQGIDHIWGPNGQLDFDWKDIIKSFGSAGSVFGIVNSIFGAKNWVAWGNVGVDLTKIISSIAKDYNN